MLPRLALAFVVMLPATVTAVQAHPFAFVRSGTGSATPHQPAFRLGVGSGGSGIGPGGSSGTIVHQPGTQPFVPLHLPLRKVEPSPAASPEWNPLRMRRMAMPGVMPGGGSDYSF